MTRARTILYKSGEKWGKNQKTRAKILFDNYEKLREGYSLICKIRSIFQMKVSQKALNLPETELHRRFSHKEYYQNSAF